MLELQSKLVQKEMFWFTDLEGPQVGFRSGRIQGCRHHDWVSLSWLCLPVLVGFALWQAPGSSSLHPVLPAALARRNPQMPGRCMGTGGTGKGRVRATGMVADLRGHVLG